MRKISLLLSLLLLPGLAPAAEKTGEQRLKDARDAFQFSDYERARGLAEALIQDRALNAESDRLDALRIAGLCWFYATSVPNNEDRAESYFRQILFVNPEYRLDPFYTPPRAVEFFDGVRSKYAGQLADIRRSRQEQEAARQREEEERLKASRIVNRDVVTHHKVLAFLPLGVGQFQNGDTGLGVALGTVQAATALTSLGCWVAVAVLNSQHPRGYTGDSYSTTHGLNVAAVATGGAFFATWIFSSAQALSGFEPEIIREVPGDTHAGDHKKNKNETASTLRVTPFAGPVPGGGVAGVNLGF